MPQNNLTQNRDKYIDFLRALGLILIVLVHCDPPPLVAQLRCFDVCLMVFVSGISLSIKQNESYKNYLIKRTKRLVIPVWIFLFLYIIFLKSIDANVDLSNSIIIDSFLLRSGIGYIWIFRVFLLMMLISPLIVWVNNKIKSEFVLLSLITFVLLLQYWLVLIYNSINLVSIRDNLEYYILDLLGYSMPFLLGYRLRKNKNLIFWCYTSIMCLTIGIIVYIFINGLPLRISPQYKYPPYGYYLIYGMIIPVFLLFFKPVLKRIVEKKLISFIGANTCWIYLWHIPLLSLLGVFINNWLLLYISVLFCSVLFYYAQRIVVSFLFTNNIILRYLR